MTIKGLYVTNTRKPGKPVRWYVYAWRGGPLIAKREGGPRPKLTADESAALLQAIADARRPDPAVLRSLIHEWRISPEWKALAPGTQKVWGSRLNAIEAKWGATPLILWSDPRLVQKVMKWRNEQAATPRTADMGVTVLRELLKFGRLSGRIAINVAAEIPTLYRGGNRADIIWTDDDMDRFAWTALKLDRPQLIDGLWLAALTGLRRDDLVTVSRRNIFDVAIVKKALKVSKRRRRTATLPRIAELDALLHELDARDRAEGVETLLVNSFGQPWSGDGFGGSFGRVRDAAGIFHVDEETGQRRRKHLHDLRGTFCTKLIETTDLTNKEIADVMAWSPDRVDNIRRTYVDQSRVIVALGERIAASAVNRTVNQSGGTK